MSEFLPKNGSPSENIPTPQNIGRPLNMGGHLNRLRPSDTVPLRPARMTHLEAAALEEMAMLCRDAAIARCFGCSPSHLTRKRKTNKPSWDQFERRWLTDGAAIYAHTRRRQEARETARQQRLRDAALVQRRQDAAAEEAIFHDLFAHGGTISAVSTESDAPAVPLSSWERFGKSLLGFFGQSERMGWILLGITVYFVFGALYPGGWTGGWADWLGVGR